MNGPLGCTTRTRRMTKKGKEYQISMLFEKRKKLHARIMRKSKLIDDLIYSSSNIITVKEETQQLSDQFNMLMETHNAYLKLLPPEALVHEEDWFDRIDENVCTHKHKIHNWIRTCEVDDRKSEKSGSSKRSSSKSSHKSSDRGSKKSSKSEKSPKLSVKQMAIEDKLKMAQLMVEASYMEEKQSALFKAQKLKQEEELAKLKARSKIFDEMQNNEQPDENEKDVHVPQKSRYVHDREIKGENHDKLKIKMKWDGVQSETRHHHRKENGDFKKSAHLNPNAPSYKPIMNTKKDLYGILTSMIQQQAVPEVELDTFDGNPLEYNYFMDLFYEVVQKWIEDPKGRLLRLLKYTKGEAHDLIKHCVQEPSYMGYSTAKGLLRKRYGDPHIILSSYRREVRSWPKLRFGDAKGFREFYNFLVKCDGVAKEQNWNAINTPDVICMLVLKLPNGLIDRWNRTAYNIRKRHDREPNLTDLIAFVYEETTLVNDPMFSRNALEEYNSEKHEKYRKNGSERRRYEKGNHGVKAFATGADGDSKCVYCSANHDIDECDDFKKLPIKERSKFYFKNKLCFACCSPISGEHSSKNCTKRRKCNVCKGGHPTSLHGFQFKQKDGKDGKKSEGNLRKRNHSKAIAPE